MHYYIIFTLLCMFFYRTTTAQDEIQLNHKINEFLLTLGPIIENDTNPRSIKDYTYNKILSNKTSTIYLIVPTLGHHSRKYVMICRPQGDTLFFGHNILQEDLVGLQSLFHQIKIRDKIILYIYQVMIHNYYYLNRRIIKK